MREIKFRVWDTDSKRYFYDVCVGNGGAFYILDGTKEYYSGTPEQFTGLKDKNGRDIYEGDIVRDLVWTHSNIWVIEWVAFTAQFLGREISDTEARYGLFQDSIMEVIGNIYEDGGIMEHGT